MDIFIGFVHPIYSWIFGPPCRKLHDFGGMKKSPPERWLLGLNRMTWNRNLTAGSWRFKGYGRGKTSGEKKEINFGDIPDVAPDLLCHFGPPRTKIYTKETDHSFGLFQGSDIPKSHGTKSTQTFEGGWLGQPKCQFQVGYLEDHPILVSS